jgi:hypothetical protein
LFGAEERSNYAGVAVDSQKNQRQTYLGREFFQHSLVEISSPTGKILGVGCFATTTKILTCLHPFRKIDVSKLQVTSIDGKKRSYKIRSATHENQYPDLDLLVIEVEVDHYRRGGCVELDLEPDIRASKNFSIYHPSANLVPIQALFSSQELRFSLVKQENASLVGCPVVDRTTGKVGGIVNKLENRDGRAISLKEIIDRLPDLASVNQYITHVQCNLPERKQQKLIGRKEELQTLLKYLSPQHIQHIVEVNGVGGIGKTELALTAANECLLSYQRVRSKTTAPIFDAVVFVSSNGYDTDLDYPDTGLLRVLDAIGDTLKIPNFNPYTEAKDFSPIYEALSRKTTLLILDGWDNSIDIDRIWNFLDNVPYPTKVLITARERKSSYSCISLKPLTPDQSRDFILQQALNSDKAAVLESVPGVPSILLRAIAQIRSGQYAQEQELDLATGSDPEIFDIDRSIDSIAGTNGAGILYVLSLFANSASTPAIYGIVDIPSKLLVSGEVELKNALQQLEDLQLIIKLSPEREKDRRYKLLATVRECALERSDLLNMPTQKVVRSKWVKWYCNFAQSAPLNKLEAEWENIQEVLTWCQNERDFNSIKTIWLKLDKLVEKRQDWAMRFYWWKYLEEGFSQRSETMLNMRALFAIIDTCLEMGDKHITQFYFNKASCLLEEEPYELRKACKLETYVTELNQIAVAINANVDDGLYSFASP